MNEWIGNKGMFLTTEFQLINGERMMELELGNHHSKNYLRQGSPIDTKISG